MLSWGSHLSIGQGLLVLCHSSPTRLVHSLTCLAPTDNWICSPESKTHGPPHGHLLQVSPDGGWSEPKCYRGDQPSEREKDIKLKLHSNDFISRNWNRGLSRHPHSLIQYIFAECLPCTWYSLRSWRSNGNKTRPLPLQSCPSLVGQATTRKINTYHLQ